MEKQDELWKEIVNYRGRAPREIVIAYIKAVVQDAMGSSFEEFARVDSGENLSKGELIASKLITALGQQEWLDNDEELSNILSIAGQLDMETSRESLWRELFEEVDRL